MEAFWRKLPWLQQLPLSVPTLKPFCPSFSGRWVGLPSREGERPWGQMWDIPAWDPSWWMEVILEILMPSGTGWGMTPQVCIGRVPWSPVGSSQNLPWKDWKSPHKISIKTPRSGPWLQRRKLKTHVGQETNWPLGFPREPQSGPGLRVFEALNTSEARGCQSSLPLLGVKRVTTPFSLHALVLMNDQIKSKGTNPKPFCLHYMLDL